MAVIRVHKQRAVFVAKVGALELVGQLLHDGVDGHNGVFLT